MVSNKIMALCLNKMTLSERENIQFLLAQKQAWEKQRKKEVKDRDKQYIALCNAIEKIEIKLERERLEKEKIIPEEKKKFYTDKKVIRKWKDLNDTEKEDSEFLTNLLIVYMDAGLELGEHYSKIFNMLTSYNNKIEKIKEDQVLELEKEKLRKQEAEASTNAFQQLIDKYDMYYLSNEGKYMLTIRKSTNIGIESERELITPAALSVHTGLEFGPEGIDVLNNILRVNNRCKITTVMSFREQLNDDILNLISTKNWLLPTKGDVHHIFDIIMDSISDGKVENKEHIEKCLVYKYLHPECYKIPTITISGSGGIGKNEFVDGPLACIFSVEQVVTLGSAAVFGAYNGQMVGRSFVYIDEAITEKTDADKMKQMSGNPTININEKFGLQGTFDNTPWYWLGGNQTNGNLMLSGDTTDRRYSVMTAKRSLFYWIAKYLQLNANLVPGCGEIITDVKHPASAWWNEHSCVLKDKEQVSKWLYKLVMQHGEQLSPPLALHSEDYNEIREAQENTLERTMEHVFDEEFDHIEHNDLYQVYGVIHRRSFIGNSGRAFGQARFESEVRSWLIKNQPQVEEIKKAVIYVPITQHEVFHEGKSRRTTANVFAIVKNSDKKHGYFRRNTAKYIEKSGDFGDVFLVEKYITQTKTVLDKGLVG